MKRGSVRRGRRPGRRLLGLAVLVSLASAGFTVACDGWPPGKRGDGTSSGSTPDGAGVCSGSPLPCSALTGADCSGNAGCVDNGTCVGQSTVTGAVCSTSSPTVCSQTPGCFWSGSCTGTPFGTCSAATKQSCLVAKGCVWTPTVSLGTGGSTGGACDSYLGACGTAADCTCGFACVRECAGCATVCGNSCRTDGDCAGTIGAGVPTLVCEIVEAGSPGICVSR